jgi:hypothetical protein
MTYLHNIPLPSYYNITTMLDHHILTESFGQVGCGTFNPISTWQLFNSLPANELSNIDIDWKNYYDIPKTVLVEGKDPESSVEIMHGYISVTNWILKNSISLEQAYAVIHIVCAKCEKTFPSAVTHTGLGKMFVTSVLQFFSAITAVNINKGFVLGETIVHTAALIGRNGGKK